MPSTLPGHVRYAERAKELKMISETISEQLMATCPPVYWCDGPSGKICDLGQKESTGADQPGAELS